MRDAEGEQWKEYLRAAVLFLVLSPNGNHQQDMLFRVAEYKKLEELPAYKVGPAKVYVRFAFPAHVPQGGSVVSGSSEEGEDRKAFFC